MNFIELKFPMPSKSIIIGNKSIWHIVNASFLYNNQGQIWRNITLINIKWN